MTDAQTEARAIAADAIERCRALHDYAGRPAWEKAIEDAIATALSERDATIAELERQLRAKSQTFCSMLATGVCDALARAERAESSLAEREAEMGRMGAWQPIETAPVNGPDFIAWVIDIIDEYDEDDRLVVRGKKVGRAVIAQCVSFTGEGRGEVVEIPWKFVQGRQYTHWMPLPAAPATRTGGQE